MKSKSLMMKELRDRRLASGLVELKLWLTPELKEKVKLYIKNEGNDNAHKP